MKNSFKTFFVLQFVIAFAVVHTSCSQSQTSFTSRQPDSVVIDSTVTPSIVSTSEATTTRNAVNLPEGPILYLSEGEVFSTDIEMSLVRIHKITLVPGAVNASITGPISLTSDATELVIDVPTGSTLDISGGMLSQANVKLEKIGEGTLILNGSNTFPAGIKLSAGTLQISQGANIGTGPLELQRGNFYVTGSTTLSQPILLTGQNVNLIALTGQTLTLAGPLSGPGGYIASGGGILKLANSIANTYQGITYISNATLLLASSANDGAIIGDGLADGSCFQPDIVVQSGGRLIWANGRQLQNTASIELQNGGYVSLDVTGNPYWIGPYANEIFFNICANGGTFNSGRGMNLIILH